MDIGRRYSDNLEENPETTNSNRNDSTSKPNKPRKIKKTENKVVINYLKNRDVAPWFRGTSHFHMQGADKLLNALRDDTEQSTTHRVRSCLNLIGLEPMITSKEIMFLMRLSRGNDLVFLWFLMEMHYKTPKHKNSNAYSMNEQLICSAICHLDMITTLRELDKILPSGHTSRIEMKKAGLHRQQIKELFEKQNNENIPSKYVLPYFRKNPRPQHFGKLLYLDVPNFKVDFDIYSSYSNLNHTVQNESNRWHAKYNFNPGKRIVHLIIGEIITNIFNNLNESTLTFKNLEVLCCYHKTLKITKIILQHELNVQKRNDCLKYYFKSKDEKDKHVEKIKKLLKEAVHQKLIKLNNQTGTSKKENKSLKVISSSNKIYNVILGDNFKGQYNNLNTINDGANKFTVKDVDRGKYKLYRGHIDHKSLNSIQSINSKGNIMNNGKSNENIKIPTNSNLNEFDNENITDIRNTSSEVEFRRTTMHKPFKFNYRKIFFPKLIDDEKKHIQKMLLSALDVYKRNSTTDLEQSDLKYDNAIRECTKSILDNEVKKYEEKMKNEIEALNPQYLKPLRQYPTLANYNSEDHMLMDRMLFDAFQYLRKNPKFVWAQLPEAHKVPILREWIAHRFGKEYAPMERAESYRTSCKIFRALDKNNFKSPLPNASQIGKNHFLNYNCRKYLHKKVQHIRNKYYYHLDSTFLQYTRIFWFATRGYICSNGPPRKTFFAYMPSRIRDIQHFRLWKSYEYRNYKVSRNVQHLQKNCNNTF